jgi:prepilin-type N-terminal cleavage/methylation domain-containing protein
MRRDRAGFTLVEIVMVIVIVAGVFAVGGLVMGRAFESYDLARTSTDTDWQGRVAFERMVRELREIRSVAATDLSFPGAFPSAQIRFIGANGTSGCFALSGGSLQRGDDAPAAASCATNLRPLADNVAAGGLNFYYYASDGSEAVSVGLVRYITVTLAVSRGGVSETYRSTVRLRRI